MTKPESSKGGNANAARKIENDPDTSGNIESRAPVIPAFDQRMPVDFVDGLHPALDPIETLLQSCELRTQRRSGPGGQHRNKTSSGVFLTHRATGIVGEATERRSQAQNRSVACSRLRFRLAVEVRTLSVLDQSETGAVVSEPEATIRKQYSGGKLKINDSNEAKPAVLALILNDLHAAGGQPSAVAPAWRTSTSAVIALIKSHPAAMAFANQVRTHHGRRRLHV